MSVTASLPEVTRRNRVARALLIVVVLLLAAVVLVAAWAWWIARANLPQLDGAVAVPGLSAKVRVVRDEQGVPTIDAETLDDLFFAQGYVTAQDRLWQMDVMRRAAAGELSEVVGPATLKIDRRQRILGLRAIAEEAAKKVSGRDREYLEAYARGVNAFIASHRDRMMLEFRLMCASSNALYLLHCPAAEAARYEVRPWTIADSFVIGASMVQDLNHYSYSRALTREKILAKIGPELTGDLYVNSSWRDRPPTEMRAMDEQPAASGDADDDDDDDDIDPEGAPTNITSVERGSGVLAAALLSLSPLERLSGFAALDSRGRLSPRETVEDDVFRPGSNDWVVSGQHTVTGKPLLSNDMHLDHEMPNLWFEVHLKSGKFDVAGVALPGVPFVIVGHNARIGWGFTNVGPTVEDDYIEEFNAQGQYKTPSGWATPQHRQETIHIKGGPDVTLDVVTTRHGPIISDIIPGETRQVALRWTLYDGLGLPFFDVNSADNWDSFRAAFAKLGAPGQNVVYADVDGNIGYQATGHVPIRAAGDGSLPVSGADDAHEWKGYIPYDEMPHVYDPPNGIIATANGRIAPDAYRFSISTEWDAPWRTDRIYRVLESGKKFAPADMLALQMDVSSTFDRMIADKFVYALDHGTKASGRARRAADILRDWDGRMSADSAAPTIEVKARMELMRMLLEPKLGKSADAASKGATAGAPPSAADVKETGELTWKSYRWGMSTVWLENVLNRQPARWLPADYADYTALLTAAMESALAQKGVPSDLGKWKWGENYPVEIEHPVLSQLPVLGRFTGPGRHPLSGDNYTVRAVGRHFGPSERATWNFANLDESTLNVVTGESGVFPSPNYLDQWRAWYEGSTFTLPFSAAAVEKHRAHEMTLGPR